MREPDNDEELGYGSDIERWLPVPDYEGLYEVSDQGRVRSLPRYNPRGGHQRGRMLKPRNVGSGYRQVTLCDGTTKKQTLIHRIVCAAFHGPAPTSKHQVDHINHDRSDDRAVNLEWVTCKENINRIEYNPGNSKPVFLIDEHGNATLFESMKAASEKTGCSKSEIYNSAHGLKNKTTNRTWVFANA